MIGTNADSLYAQWVKAKAELDAKKAEKAADVDAALERAAEIAGKLITILWKGLPAPIWTTAQALEFADWSGWPALSSNVADVPSIKIAS